MNEKVFSYTTISKSLATTKFGHPLYYYDSTGSTNNEAKTHALNGEPEGTLIVANEQIAGRGRFDRRWFTPKGSGLAVSFILRSKLSNPEISQIPLLGGLATAYAIEQLCNISPKLKWPNDIWIEQKKIAGILVETSYTENLPEWQILGVGVNVNSRPLEVTNPSYDASCLADIIGHKVDRVNLLQQLVHNVGLLYNQLEQNSIREEWQKRMLWRDQYIEVIDSGHNPIEGITLGIGSNGALIIQLSNGDQRKIYSGEIRLKSN